MEKRMVPFFVVLLSLILVFSANKFCLGETPVGSEQKLQNEYIEMLHKLKTSLQNRTIVKNHQEKNAANTVKQKCTSNTETKLNFKEAISGNQLRAALTSDYVVFREREPNNNITQANFIDANYTGQVTYHVTGTITDYYFDMDYFRFDVLVSGKFDLMAFWGAGSSHWEKGYEDDLAIVLYNNNGDLITFSRLYGYGSSAYQGLEYNVAPGTYYMLIFQISDYKYLYTDEPYAFFVNFIASSQNIPVSSVSLNKTSMPLFQGEKETLVASITPSNAANKAVNWSSSNPAVATVDNGGLVTGIGVGTANITVTTADGNKTATCSVTVKEPVIAVQSVNLNHSSVSLDKGRSLQLTATILPTNATNKAVNWSSSNPAIATVDSNGLVTGIGIGTTIITVITADGNKTATCSVTVKEPVIAVQSVSLNKSSTRLIKGETETLAATIFPANASNRQLGWISSNTSVATVNSSGSVIAIAPGLAMISVVSADGGKIASCSVNVISPLTALIQEQLNQNLGEYFSASATGTTVRATIQTGKIETNIEDAFAIEPVLQMLSAIDRSYPFQGIRIGSSTYTREDVLDNFPAQVDDIKNDVLVLVANPDINSYEEVTLGDLVGKYITLVFAEEEIRLELCQQDECFIATAAFGSKLQPAVVLLRQFRDKALLTNSLGRAFVAFYYQNSPPIAHYIAGNETAKLIVRILLLPFIAIAYMVMNPAIIIVLLLLLLSIILYRRRAPLQP